MNGSRILLGFFVGWLFGCLVFGYFGFVVCVVGFFFFWYCVFFGVRSGLIGEGLLLLGDVV